MKDEDMKMDVKNENSGVASRIKDALTTEYAKTAAAAVCAFIAAPCELFAGLYPFGIALSAAVNGFGPSAAASCAAMFAMALTARENPLALYYIASLAALFGVRSLIGRLGSDVRSTNDGMKQSGSLASAAERRSAERRSAEWRSAEWRSAEWRSAERLYSRCLSLAPEVAYSENAVTKCVLAGALTLLAFVSAAAVSSDAKLLFAAVLAALAVPAMTYAFCGITDEKIRKSKPFTAAAAVLLFGVVTATRDIRLLGLSPASVLAYSAALWVSQYRGAPDGAVAGLISGIALTPMYAPAYAIGPLAAGMIWKLSPVTAVCVSGTVSLAWVAYAGGISAVTAMVPSVCVALAVAAPVSHFRLLAPREKTADEADATAEKAPFAADQITGAYKAASDMIAAMTTVADVFTGLAEKLKSPSAAELQNICETALRPRCISCGRRSVCFGGTESDGDRMVEKMVASLREHGRISSVCVPESIASRCEKMAEIIDEADLEYAKSARMLSLEDKTAVLGENYAAVAAMLNGVLEKQKSDFMPDGTLTERISKAIGIGAPVSGNAGSCGIYAETAAVYGSSRKRIYVGGIDMAKTKLTPSETSALIGGIAGVRLSEPEYVLSGGRCSMTLTALPSVTVRHGRYSIPGGNEANGDAAVCFASRGGMFYSLISDGMGSGREAALTSHIAATFLTKMLGAGAGMAESLRMLNGFIRAGRLECSATVDLMELDLYSGSARFVKSGAAPTYILRQGKIFRIQSKTVPIGILRALDAEMITVPLLAGDTVIMFSDGIASSYDDSAWLLDLLSAHGSELADPAKAARFIAEQSAKRQEQRDDATVTVVKVGS